MDQKFFHSVRLDKEKCKGCTNCLKRCPTEAIRVRGGRAHIINERCIDCGECIRVCDYHAKYAQTDPLASINRFKYKIALPAPSLYGQFKHLHQRLAGAGGAAARWALTTCSRWREGADIVTRAIRERMRGIGRDRYPVISSACPAIVRLIRVRFPDLIPHMQSTCGSPWRWPRWWPGSEFCQRARCDSPRRSGVSSSRPARPR